MTVTGAVLELHRWPVKSMGGQPVDTLDVAPHGADGDRIHALLHEHKGERRRLTAREAPRLLAWGAAYVGQAAGSAGCAATGSPGPVLRAPDGTEWSWDDPALPAALADDLGREVWLHTDPRGQQDLPDSLLITVRSTLEAVSAELDTAVDLRRFRTNLHVELDAPAFAEEGWEGRRLRVGEAELEVLHPCERCAIPTRDPDTQEKWAQLLRHLTREHSQLFGINVRATEAATLRVGDPVELL